MKVLGIIPARFASTRLPGKPLIDIKGKSMIERVYRQVTQCKGLSDVLIATDHQSIFDHVERFGGKAVMTSIEHQSGTDRCNEALNHQKEQFDFIINIQGDEPFIKPEQIDSLIESLNADTEIATLAKKIENQETLFNPNAPKVIFNKMNQALYFSRHPIPYVKARPKEEWLKETPFYKHIGIYAYRADVLKEISSLEPSIIEKAESLEQLRWLESGYNIEVTITPFETLGIDSEEDLKKIDEFL